jgi:hypothetical protein
VAISSQGTTFSFSGFSALITSISIEEGQGEVVDMTAIADPVGYKRMVATGALLTPAKVSIEYLRTAGTPSPLSVVGLTGNLVVSHAALTVSKLAAIDSASHELAANDVIRGRATFVLNQTT